MFRLKNVDWKDVAVECRVKSFKTADICEKAMSVALYTSIAGMAMKNIAGVLPQYPAIRSTGLVLSAVADTALIVGCGAAAVSGTLKVASNVATKLNEIDQSEFD